MPKGAISDKLDRAEGKSPPSDEKQSIETQMDKQSKITDIRARQRAIGRELRRMFDEVAREPIPEDFLELLHQLDARDTNSRNGEE